MVCRQIDVFFFSVPDARELRKTLANKPPQSAWPGSRWVPTRWPKAILADLTPRHHPLLLLLWFLRGSKYPIFKDSGPNAIKSMVFGTRDLKYWVLGPSGLWFQGHQSLRRITQARMSAPSRVDNTSVAQASAIPVAVDCPKCAHEACEMRAGFRRRLWAQLSVLRLLVWAWL